MAIKVQCRIGEREQVLNGLETYTRTFSLCNKNRKINKRYITYIKKKLSFYRFNNNSIIDTDLNVFVPLSW